MRSTILALLSWFAVLPFVVSMPRAEAVPPTAFFEGSNLTMKFIEEGQPWYMPIYPYNSIHISYWQNASSFIPFATYGPHQQIGQPTRLWQGYVTLFKWTGSQWQTVFGSSLTYNIDGVAFADDCLIGNRTTGQYKLLFNQIVFKENGVTQYVSESKTEILFEVID